MCGRGRKDGEEDADCVRYLRFEPGGVRDGDLCSVAVYQSGRPPRSLMKDERVKYGKEYGGDVEYVKRRYRRCQAGWFV